MAEIIAIIVGILVFSLIFALFALADAKSNVSFYKSICDDWREKSDGLEYERDALQEQVDDLKVLLAATDENLKRALEQRDAWKDHANVIKKELVAVTERADRGIETQDKLDRRTLALYEVMTLVTRVATTVNAAFDLPECNNPSDCLGCPGECEYTTNEA